MVLTRTSLILVFNLMALISSAVLPEDYLSDLNSQLGSRDEELPLEAKQKCPGRKYRRLPTSATVDTRLIDSSYMESLVQMEDIHTRSLSPWDYSHNTDPNRFPFVIAEADCLTFACVDADGHQSPDLISFPIQQEVMVLRREKKGCSFSYRLEMEVVTLGCTCVTPTTIYY
ncbi:interleukin-17F-like [Ranitomeya variabilis]|uniref:interleukin-17F-like n=1 Tax=Ranitomeya variabilis TaxID=490064 RepID=UPI004055E8EA